MEQPRCHENPKCITILTRYGVDCRAMGVLWGCFLGLSASDRGGWGKKKLWILLALNRDFGRLGDGRHGRNGRAGCMCTPIASKVSSYAYENSSVVCPPWTYGFGRIWR